MHLTVFMGGACEHVYMHMCICVCSRETRCSCSLAGAGGSEFWPLEKGSRALKLMWRARLSQAGQLQRGLPGGSRTADFTRAAVFWCHLNQLQSCWTVPAPNPPLRHNTHTSTEREHKHTSVTLLTQWHMSEPGPALHRCVKSIESAVYSTW